MKHGEQIIANVNVTNTGSRAGEETVQLYVQDLHGSTARPVKMLRGFQRVMLQRGETKQVSFIIDEEMLKYHDKHLVYRAEPGEFVVHIGRNAADKLRAGFELVE